MTNQVALFIVTHNITGLKYFAKTTRFFTEEELQNNYHGSGVKWKEHLQEHGKDVTVELYGVFSLNNNDENYVSPVAKKFSKDNNITQSEKWANRKIENGLDGGFGGFVGELNGMFGKKHSEESKYKMSQNSKGSKNGMFGKTTSLKTRKKISEANTAKIVSFETRKKISESSKGKKLSEETKMKISEANSGKNHYFYGKLAGTHKNFGQLRTEETKTKISEALKGKPKQRYLCLHCNKSYSPAMLKRWHGDKCKYANNWFIR